MKLIPVKSLDDIHKGDLIIVKGVDYDMIPIKVPFVKRTEKDGTEVILNKRKNHYFNLGMYLEGKSWVKEVVKIVDQ